MGLTTAQFDEIMRSYQLEQNANASILIERKKRVNEKLPILKELNDELSKLRATQLNNLLNGNTDESIAKKIDEITKLKEEKYSALFTEDYLLPIYTCKLCKDTGFIGNEYCSCFKKKAVNLLYKKYNKTNVNPKHTFENFNYDFYSTEVTDRHTQMSHQDTIRAYVNAAKELVRNWDKHEKKKNLIISGDVGSGKTYLSECIFNESFNTLHSAVYFSSEDYIRECGNVIYKKDNSFYDSIKECDIVIIDDLGTEFVNSFTIQNFFELINSRLLCNKSTIINTNLTLDEIGKIYDLSIASRLDGEYIFLDYRGMDDLRRIQK